MSFEIYSPDFSERHEITHATSIKTSVLYNGIGKFSMILPINDYNVSVVKTGCLVLDKDSWVTFFVASVKIETARNQMSVNGYTANNILNERTVAAEEKITNVESGVYQMTVNNLRGLENVTISPASGIDGAIDETPVLGGQLLDQAVPILNMVEFGHRMVWDHRSKTHMFEIYKGRDLTHGIHAAVFSYERGTAKDLVISDDISLSKNVFYIAGTTSDGRTITEIVDLSNGKTKNEKWLSQTISQQRDETEAQLRQRMIAQAKESSADYIRRQNFQVVIDPREIGVFYALGDLVSCVSSTFGVKFTRRITGIEYTLDSRGTQTSIVLGEPNLTILKEMKLNG